MLSTLCSGGIISVKAAIIDAWRLELEARLAAATAGQKTAQSGTRVDGSHRPANRGERGAVTAQGYLALGLGQRAQALAEHLRLLDEVGTEPREAVVVGALVRLQIDDAPPKRVAILPGGDATWLDTGPNQGSHSVQLLSASSPLVRQLSGCASGDIEEIVLGGQVAQVEIIEIS